MVGTASLGPGGVASLRIAGPLTLLARAPALPSEQQAAHLAALSAVAGDRAWMDARGFDGTRRAAWTARSVAHHGGPGSGDALPARYCLINLVSLSRRHVVLIRCALIDEPNPDQSPVLSACVAP